MRPSVYSLNTTQAMILLALSKQFIAKHKQH